MENVTRFCKLSKHNPPNLSEPKLTPCMGSVDNDVAVAKMKSGETVPILMPAIWLEDSNRMTIASMGTVENNVSLANIG